MTAIRIDKPCTENWHQMAATNRGAFCQKCSIDVYDFSKMSLNQVKLTLKENAGKHFCGRFGESQLDTLNQEFETWKENQPKTIQSRFIFALLVVFGLTLFSCDHEDATYLNSLQTTNLKSALTHEDDQQQNRLFFIQDAIVANSMIKSLEVCQISNDVIQEVYPDELMIMGEMAYPVQEQIEQPVQRTSISLGGPMVDHRYIEFLQDTTSEYEAPVPHKVVVRFETHAFPNPTTDFTNFRITVTEAAQFKIHVYSMTGQLVSVLHDGELPNGKHQFEVDLSNHEPGTYIIKVWSEHHSETIKVMKVE